MVCGKESKKFIRACAEIDDWRAQYQTSDKVEPVWWRQQSTEQEHMKRAPVDS
jgi:hypothetical protein